MTDVELAVLLERIDGRLKAIDEKTERIETQTVKTNGRVTTLEKWRWILVGGIILLFFILENYRNFVK